MIRKSSDRVNPDYVYPWEKTKDLFPNYDQKEYEELKAFIASGNEVPPIVVSEDYRIVDGYNRWRAHCELGIDVPVDVYAYADEVEMEVHAICLNAKRRHLDSVTAARWALRLAELIAPKPEETKRKLSEAGKKGGKGKKALTTRVDEALTLRSERTIERAAKRIGVSPVTVRQVKKVDESGDEELIKAMERKEIPIKKAADIVDLPLEERRRAIETIRAENLPGMEKMVALRDALKPSPSGAPIFSAGCVDCLLKLSRMEKLKIELMTVSECEHQIRAIRSVITKAEELEQRIKNRYKQLTNKEL